MTDNTKTLRHTFTVQVEIDPLVWDMNYGTGPEGVQDDSVDHLKNVIETTISDWIEQSGNTGKVRMVTHERTAPDTPMKVAP